MWVQIVGNAFLQWLHSRQAWTGVKSWEKIYLENAKPMIVTIWKKKIAFYSRKQVLSNSIIVLPVSVVAYTDINRHYFQSPLVFQMSSLFLIHKYNQGEAQKISYITIFKFIFEKLKKKKNHIKKRISKDF